MNSLDRFDFAVLLLTPEDKVFVRETVNLQPRDNLMFELGLFMGRLGPSRTFMVCPSDAKMKLPSDLAGVTYLTFPTDRSDNNLKAAVRPACQSLAEAIRDLGFAEARGIQRLTKATDDVQHKVHNTVALLLRSRIWETEVFRKHYGPALGKDEMNQLDADLAKLREALTEETG